MALTPPKSENVFVPIELAAQGASPVEYRLSPSVQLPRMYYEEHRRAHGDAMVLLRQRHATTSRGENDVTFALPASLAEARYARSLVEVTTWLCAPLLSELEARSLREQREVR